MIDRIASFVSTRLRSVTLNSIPFGYLTDYAGIGYKVTSSGTVQRLASFAAGSVGATPLQYAEVALTSAEILALRATPKTLVAAPGAGLLLEFVSAVLLLDATATGYTETADNLAIRYTDGSGAIVSQAIETTGFIDQTADTMTTAEAKIDAIVAKSGCENKALVLHNTGDGEFATGTGTMRVKISYRVHKTDW